MDLLKQLQQLKRLAIYGYGQEGQSLHRWLNRHYPKLIIDILNDSPLTVAGCQVYSGADLAGRLLDYKLIFKSPGISPYQAAIQTAITHGVLFSSATNLWFASTKVALCIAITGTKGKSTTSSLLTHILRAAGRDVVLAGNIGHPLLDQPENPKAIWVLELSSYQLWDFAASPDMLVLLNLFPEHLDWHGSKARYYQDKLHIFTYPDVTSLRFGSAEDCLLRRLYPVKLDYYFNHTQALHVKDRVLYQADQALDCSGFQLRGEHNLKNLAAALTIAKQLGIAPQQACQSLDDFSPLAHRLAYLGRRQGVDFVDDSISTTPQSALAAILSFPKQAITLILGGYDRGLDWQILAQALAASRVTTVITLPDNAAKIQKAITAEPNTPPCYGADDMQMALDLALQHTQAGSLVLLSPGAPSYGHYRDFKQRGKHFAELAGFDN